MRVLHRLRSRAAGPVWGLVLGTLMSAVGLGLWFSSASERDQSMAVAAVLVGVFLAVYAAREIGRKKHR